MNFNYRVNEYLVSDNMSKNDAQLIAFLQAGIKNLILLAYKKEKESFPTVELEAAEKVAISAIDEQLDYEKFRWDMCNTSYLLKAYNTFTAREKSIFDLHYLDDITMTKIGEMLGLSPKTISTTIKRCIDKIECQKRMEFY